MRDLTVLNFLETPYAPVIPGDYHCTELEMS